MSAAAQVTRIAEGYVRYQGVLWTHGSPKPEHAHRCYELSALRVAAGPGGVGIFSGYDGAVLVHGTIQGYDLPPLAHAWVIEPDGSVWEPYTDTVYPGPVFEALFNPVTEAEYSPAEARHAMVTSGHYGPWHEEE